MAPKLDNETVTCSRDGSTTSPHGTHKDAQFSRASVRLQRQRAGLTPRPSRIEKLRFSKSSDGTDDATLSNHSSDVISVESGPSRNSTTLWADMTEEDLALQAAELAVVDSKTSATSSSESFQQRSSHGASADNSSTMQNRSGSIVLRQDRWKNRPAIHFPDPWPLRQSASNAAGHDWDDAYHTVDVISWMESHRNEPKTRQFQIRRFNPSHTASGPALAVFQPRGRGIPRGSGRGRARGVPFHSQSAQYGQPGRMRNNISSRHQTAQQTPMSLPALHQHPVPTRARPPFPRYKPRWGFVPTSAVGSRDPVRSMRQSDSWDDRTIESHGQADQLFNARGDASGRAADLTGRFSSFGSHFSHGRGNGSSEEADMRKIRLDQRRMNDTTTSAKANDESEPLRGARSNSNGMVLLSISVHPGKQVAKGVWCSATASMKKNNHGSGLRGMLFGAVKVDYDPRCESNGDHHSAGPTWRAGPGQESDSQAAVSQHSKASSTSSVTLSTASSHRSRRQLPLVAPASSTLDTPAADFDLPEGFIFDQYRTVFDARGVVPVLIGPLSCASVRSLLNVTIQRMKKTATSYPVGSLPFTSGDSIGTRTPIEAKVSEEGRNAEVTRLTPETPVLESTDSGSSFSPFARSPFRTDAPARPASTSQLNHLATVTNTPAMPPRAVSCQNPSSINQPFTLSACVVPFLSTDMQAANERQRPPHQGHPFERALSPGVQKFDQPGGGRTKQNQTPTRFRRRSGQQGENRADYQRTASPVTQRRNSSVNITSGAHGEARDAKNVESDTHQLELNTVPRVPRRLREGGNQPPPHARVSAPGSAAWFRQPPPPWATGYIDSFGYHSFPIHVWDAEGSTGGASSYPPSLLHLPPQLPPRGFFWHPQPAMPAFGHYAGHAPAMLPPVRFYSASPASYQGHGGPETTDE